MQEIRGNQRKSATELIFAHLLLLMFMNQVRSNSKRQAVIVTFLYRADNARKLAYDLVGFYRMEKYPTLLCELVRNVSFT